MKLIPKYQNAFSPILYNNLLNILYNIPGIGDEAEELLNELSSSDAIKASFSQTKPYNGTFEEIVTRNGNQMKLADAVTYDELGKRIPLGLRDNFNISDLRYGAIPFALYPAINKKRRLK